MGLPNEPITRQEIYLSAIAGQERSLPDPVTRVEQYLAYIAENGGGGGGTSNYNSLSNKPSINGATLIGNKPLSDFGIPEDLEDFDYSHVSVPDVSDAKEALDAIIDKLYYVKPSITSFVCNPATLSYEIGSEVSSVDFTWALNKAVTAQTLTGCDITAEDRSASYETPFSTNKTFTLTVTDGENSATASKSFTFLPKVYCGVDVLSDNYDGEFIVGLGGTLKSSKAGTYSLNIGTGKYGFIAVPTNYGKINTVKIGGFDTEMVDCGTISVTNESGYTQNYYLCRTPQPNLGNISMVVS